MQYHALHLNYPVSYAVHDVKVHGTTRLAATNRTTSVIAHSYRYSNNTRGCVFIRKSYLEIFALKETACTLPPDCKRCAQRTRPCYRTMQLTAIVRRHTPCSCRCIGRLVPSPRRLRHLQNDAGYKPLHDNSAVVKRPYRLEMSHLLQAPSTRTLRIPMRTRVGPTPSFTSASRAKSLFRL